MLSIRFNQRATDTHVTPTLDRLAGKHGQENEDPGLMSDGLESVGSPTTGLPTVASPTQTAVMVDFAVGFCSPLASSALSAARQVFRRSGLPSPRHPRQSPA